jgi:hypothetical protein
MLKSSFDGKASNVDMLRLTSEKVLLGDYYIIIIS